MKDFDSWNKEKKRIDQFKKYPHPKIGEIWYVRVGMNVGSEIYGKGTEYVRPVLVLNADDSESFIGAPITSKLKRRRYSEIIKTQDEKLHSVLMYQIKLFDKRRLIRRRYILDMDQYLNLKSIFYSLYKIQ